VWTIWDGKACGCDVEKPGRGEVEGGVGKTFRRNSYCIEKIGAFKTTTYWNCAIIEKRYSGNSRVPLRPTNRKGCRSNSSSQTTKSMPEP